MIVEKGYCKNEGLDFFLIRSMLKVRFDAKRYKLFKTVSIIKKMCGFVHVVPFLSKFFG